MTEKCCAVEHCERPYAARGWCHYHYHRAVNYGAPDALTKREEKYGRRPADDDYIDEIAVERAVAFGITGNGESAELTRTECDEVILRMTDRGCTRAEMARATGYSVHTIQDRMYQVRFRLNMATRSDLAEQFKRAGTALRSTEDADTGQVMEW